MILQTMNDKEKYDSLKSFLPIMKKYGETWISNRKNRKSFLRVKKYPSSFSSEMDLTNYGLGKWTLVVMCESKEYKIRGIVTLFAYQKFTTQHTKKETNAGTGIYVFSGYDSGGYAFDEISPHYINRIMERCDFYSCGKKQPNFDTLIIRILNDLQVEQNNAIIYSSVDLKLGEFSDFVVKKTEDTDRQDGYKNLVVYHEHGLSLGLESIDTNYRIFLTYVPNNMLTEEQIKQKNTQFSVLFLSIHVMLILT